MLDWGGGQSDEGKEREQAGVVRNPQEGQRLTLGQMQVTIKATAAETAGRFSLLEVTVPPYFADIWPHCHRQTAEAIYLTHGMLAVTLGEETMVVRQGSFILIPPEQAHRVWNPAATSATFLAYFSPAGAEGFLTALAEMDLDEQAASPTLAAKIWALGMNFDYFPLE